MQVDRQSKIEVSESLNEMLMRLWPLIKVGLIFVLALLPLTLAAYPRIAVGLGVLITLAGYTLLARATSRSLVLNADGLIAVMAVFILLALELIFLYATYYANVALAGSPGGDAAPLSSFTDAFYFSAAIFTSLGFGDIVPLSPAGKWMVTSEALLGMTHAVLFVVVFLRNLDFSTANGSSDPTLE